MEQATRSENKALKTATRDLEIGDALNRLSQFIQAKDLAGVMELYADDVVVFDLMTPYQFVGSRALMERVSDWFKGYEGAISYDFDQLRIHSDESLAVAHALINCSGVIKGDVRHTNMWMRKTFTFMKQNGDWLISHEHSSEPFDMATGRAVSQRDGTQKQNADSHEPADKH